MTKDIEPVIIQSSEHSLRYLHIIVNNVVGILNRVTSLLRRKRYNLEEISVSYDDESHAHFVFAIDGDAHNIDLMMHQLRKLHDVLSVTDATNNSSQFLNAFFVYSENKSDFSSFPTTPLDIFKREQNWVALFRVPLEHTVSFAEFLGKNSFHYRRRVVTLL